MTSRSLRRRSAVAIVLLSTVLAVLTACSSGSGEAEKKPVPAAVVQVDASGRAVAVNDPVALTVEHGTFTGATLVNESTQRRFPLHVSGRRAELSQPLAYGTRYRVEFSYTGEDGKTAYDSRTFRTVKPNNLTLASVTPGDGANVGVAQPITVRFDEPVPDRKAAEKVMTVTTSTPIEGAWHWFSDQEVRWRPKDLWPDDTKVSVKIGTYGHDLGGGLYGQADTTSKFVVGQPYSVFVSNKDKIVRVFKNGKQIKTMPTSMGKPGHETPSGLYYVGAEKNASMVMTSASYGVTSGPEAYSTPVNYATRISSGGIFVHAAPWSVWAQGNTNTSHGCLNVNDADAAWFMRHVPEGTPVKIVGTGAPLPTDDGMADWEIPWSEWSRG